MTLADRIAHYIAGTGRPLTSREIAKGMRVRHADVLEALRGDGRFTRWPDAKRNLYGVQEPREHVGAGA